MGSSPTCSNWPAPTSCSSSSAVGPGDPGAVAGAAGDVRHGLLSQVSGGGDLSRQADQARGPARQAGRGPGARRGGYIGWRALEYATGIGPGKVQLQTVGYTQIESLLNDQIDAAVVYATNEPVRFRQMGKDPSVIEVSDYIDLVANGLITNEKAIAETRTWCAGWCGPRCAGCKIRWPTRTRRSRSRSSMLRTRAGRIARPRPRCWRSRSSTGRNPRVGYADPKAWEA